MAEDKEKKKSVSHSSGSGSSKSKGFSEGTFVSVGSASSPSNLDPDLKRKFEEIENDPDVEMRTTYGKSENWVEGEGSSFTKGVSHSTSEGKTVSKSVTVTKSKSVSKSETEPDKEK